MGKSLLAIKWLQLIHFTRSYAFQSILAYKNWWMMYIDYFNPLYKKEYILDTHSSGSYYIRAKSGDITVANEIVLQKEYAKNPSNKNMTSQNKNTAIIDVGSHIGLYAISQLKGATHKHKFYCYEPEITNFEQLRRNIELNDLSKWIIPINCAISSSTSEKIFFVGSKSAGGTIMNNLDMGLLGHYTNTVQVSSTTLAAEIKRYKIDLILQLKLDCEGSEYEILYSTSSKIFKKINEIYVECHPLTKPGLQNSPKSLLKFLQNNGYLVDLVKKLDYIDIELLHAVRYAKA